MNIGENIKKLRKSMDISSSDLANAVGITRSQISKIETGSSNPSIDVLKKIASTLNCTVSELIGESTFYIPPEIKSLIEASHNLSTEQIELLTKFLKLIK